MLGPVVMPAAYGKDARNQKGNTIFFRNLRMKYILSLFYYLAGFQKVKDPVQSFSRILDLCYKVPLWFQSSQEGSFKN